MPGFRDDTGLTISRQDAARATGFSMRTIRKMCETGELELVQLAGQERIARRSVETLLARLRGGGPTASSSDRAA